jgi:hypothetical protein
MAMEITTMSINKSQRAPNMLGGNIPFIQNNRLIYHKINFFETWQ